MAKLAHEKSFQHNQAFHRFITATMRIQVTSSFGPRVTERLMVYMIAKIERRDKKCFGIRQW